MPQAYGMHRARQGLQPLMGGLLVTFAFEPAMCWEPGALAMLTLQSLNSGGRGEKYQVSISKRPSSMRSTFFTLVNSSCSRREEASKPWCSPSSSSTFRRCCLNTPTAHDEWKHKLDLEKIKFMVIFKFESTALHHGQAIADEHMLGSTLSAMLRPAQRS